jgi:integrase
LTQETAESEEAEVRFPKRIKRRGQVLAVIYGRTKKYGYRVAWRVFGQRRMQRFKTYAEAKKHADELVKDLAKGSQVSALTPAQARDALAALERLRGFFQATGRKVSLLSGISEFCEATGKLTGHTLGEAVDGYLSSVASVKRKDLAEAVEEFIKTNEPRTRSTNGERAQLSAKYAYNRAIILHRFAETLKNTAVSDLDKQHLDAFIGSLDEFSAKSRNHHRGAIRQFLGWCVRKDYLSPTNRLGEADAMRPELANNGQIQFYTAKEFRTLLEYSEGPMQAMIAIGGLAGLRTAELLRLDWGDVWRVFGYIEVTAGKSKTRQRRLVEIGLALSAWLEPFRSITSGRVCPITAASAEILWQQQFLEICAKAGVTRRRNGLRHSFCSYSYVLYGENATAQAAGHAPALLHAHYRGLATRTESEKWFSIFPSHPGNVGQMSTAVGQQELTVG